MSARSKSSSPRPALSAIVTTFNEEAHIAACIESLLWCDEILVVDSFSTDRTPEICRGYDKVRFFQRTYFGSASQKNWAMDQVTNDWILIFDADERCTPALQREIEELLAAGPQQEAYTINRRVYFLDRVIRFSGWQHDQVVRLVRNGSARYPNRRVHADMLTRGPAPVLRNPMEHYMADTLDEYIRRIEKYSFWGAAQNWKERKKSGFMEIFGRSIWRFFRTYIFQLGVLDGMHGLVFCMLQSYGTYLKWTLLWGWHINAARGRMPALPIFDESEETWRGLDDEATARPRRRESRRRRVTDIAQQTAQSLLAHLRARTAEMAALLLDLARLESPSLDAASQEPVFARLTSELEALGFRVRRLPGRQTGGQLWAVPSERRQGAPAQLLLGHCDTVRPRGTVESMPVAVSAGKLTGPGVYDMKAGLVQGIFALWALRDLGLTPEVTPTIFIDSDEEIGSLESIPRLERAARRMRRVFVLEPSLGPEGKLKTRRKGSLRFTIRIQGRAAHSGLDPEKGASAILELSRVIQRLYELADPERGITVNVGVVSGGLRANVVAPEARAELDIRVLATDDALRLERTVLGLAPLTPGTALEILGGIDRPPLEATPGNRLLWEAARRSAAALGIPLAEGTAGGASDGSLTSRFVPTLDGLGAVGDGAHALHEHVLVDRMPERAALLALLLLEPIGGP